MGRDNFYWFASNAQIWLNPLGLKKYSLWNTDRKKLKKGQKSNFNPKKLKPEEINGIHLLMNKTRDAKRQKAMVAGRNHILKNGCKNIPII